MTSGAGDRVRLAVPAEGDAFAQVRRFVHLFAQQSGVDDDRADDLVQAAAELLATDDAARRPTAVEVQEAGDGITVVVDLAGPEDVQVRAESAALLSSLSRDWGWRRTPDALQVWCEVAAREPAP
ncbi:ATP-binding protein [Kineococcus esterisolvens]|uniref:ATP-binding protein n=1 Tax=unclassified Kineococcus TaxID=2621656 RepID=UPI003D7EF36D